MLVNADEYAFMFLNEAEQLFGRRIEGWKFVGTEDNDIHNPQILYYPESGEITVSLTKKIYECPTNFIGQLAHEIAHILHPSMNYHTLERDKTLVINEGIAELFSSIMMKNILHYSDEDIKYVFENKSDKYYDAYKLVKAIHDTDNTFIKRLRVIQPKIDRVTYNDIKSVDSSLSDETINKLITPFNS